MTILPDFDAATFEPGAPVDNRFSPLLPGTILSYAGTKVDEDTGETETESNDVFVTSETKTIQGVQTVVVRDTAYADGVLVEDTLDWFAQDTEGNVWYLGEIAYNYEYDDGGNYVETNNDGSWEAGVDGALPGYIMPADPDVGDDYFQEFAPGIAEDEGLVVGVDQEVSIGLGDFDGVLKTLDTTELEPGVAEFKYYAPDIGQVLGEEGLDDEGVPELVLELQGIREVGGNDDDGDFEQPEAEDFEGEGKEIFVTFVGAETEFDNALGAYLFDLETGEIGEGRILFDGTEELAAGDSISVEVDEGQGLGLFLIADVEEFGLDLSEFEDGGLFFTNILTGETATLDDGLAPLVTNADGVALPIHALHALGGDDGYNLLNPAAGAHAIELEPEWAEDGDDDEVLVLGFEDLRVTQEGYDGDFDDLILAVSEEPLDGGEGLDLPMGGDGNEHLDGGEGHNLLVGEGDIHEVVEYEIGVDKIELGGEALSFGDLLAGSGAASSGAEIDYGFVGVLLAAVTTAEIEVSDLIF